MNIIWNDLNTSYGSIYLFNKQSSIDTENESIYGTCNNYELLIERKVKPIRGKFELMFRNTVNSEHFNLLGQYNSIAKAKEAAEKFMEGE